MIRAVNPAVTVQTRFTQKFALVRASTAGQLRGIEERTGMTRIRMAGLAQIRCLQLEHRQMVRAVRIVAATAILPHRRVLPQHWPAFFLMADVTGFVERCLYQQIGSQTAVRVMTTGTTHLVFPERHMGRPQHA